MKLTKNEMTWLRKINKRLPTKRISEIYLPLSHLLNFYYTTNSHYQTNQKKVFNIKKKFKNYDPYIISISGSVSVGKSTTARILQTLLQQWPEHRHVELVTTDGFLYPNQVLKERNLMDKKGFPQTYDVYQLKKFIYDLKSGVTTVKTPIYSHIFYDILPKKNRIISRPNILILEGLNILYNSSDYNSHYSPSHVFISDFVDFSIYVDASEDLIKTWYINRFLKFCSESFKYPYSYFYNYASLTKEEAINKATFIWDKINYVNLRENILPTRNHASLILIKSKDHIVNQVYLRR